MRWRRRARSRNLEDRRGASGGFGGLGGLGALGGLTRMGLPGILALVVILFLTRGGGVGDPLDGLPSAPGAVPNETGPDPDAELVDFVSFVLDDAQSTWEAIFAEGGDTYRPAQLVLFEAATDTGCGYADASVGPFYCPADTTVYLDLGFFRELQERFGAPGDFAQAYVIAHEIAHHVQQQLGISDDVRAEQGSDPDRANELSVLLELQADCLAGVWAHTTYERRLLESGDLEEGLDAASAVGDDRIQKEATGRIDRESWTHGSSQQRREWFRRGFDRGEPSACDTFAS